MNVLTKILGILLIVGGIVAGIWIDIVILLVGGIKQIVAGFSVDPWNGSDIAWGVVHLVFCGVGGVVAFIIIAGGISLVAYGSFRRPKRRTRAVRGF